MVKKKPLAQKQEPSYKDAYRGLRKIGGTGYGFDDVRRTIERHHIPYQALLYPGRHGQSDFLVNSLVAVPANLYGAAIMLFPGGKKAMHGYYACNAEHEIIPGFDMNRLDGLVKFRKGRILEQTIIKPAASFSQ